MYKVNRWSRGRFTPFPPCRPWPNSNVLNFIHCINCSDDDVNSAGVGIKCGGDFSVSFVIPSPSFRSGEIVLVDWKMVILMG